MMTSELLRKNPAIVFYHPLASTPGVLNCDFPVRGSDQAWTIQTAGWLYRRGYPAHLADRFSPSDILLCHPRFIYDLALPRRQFLVSLRSDKTVCPRANIEIVQNPYQANDSRSQQRIYMPHFPQKGLIPRESARETQFLNVGFFGEIQNLHESIRDVSFQAKLRELGMRLIVRDRPESWHDYSDIDVVVAVRDFHKKWRSKPATKLFNAWHTGVPIILGPEHAYQYYRRSSLDYIEARSSNDIFVALEMLRARPEIRQKMAQNGFERAREVSFEAITDRWIQILDEVIRPAGIAWARSIPARMKFHSRLRRKSGGQWT